MTAVPPPDPEGLRSRGRARPLSLRERRRLQPPRVAQILVALAVSNLPPQHRERYMLEFCAELYGIRRSAQIAYSGALLLHSWRLGAALSEPDPAVVKEGVVRKDWRCRLGFHRYLRRVNPDAEGPFKAYLECVRCRHHHDIGLQIGN